MSSWDTNLWGNICDPYWELICHNKWQPRTSEISKPTEITVVTHFHVQQGTKTSLVFLPADGETSWTLLPGLVWHSATRKQLLKVTGQVWKSQKKDKHQHLSRVTPAFISLSQSQVINNKTRFNFNKPNTKRWGVRLVDVVKHLSHRLFCCGTITRRVANQC